MQLRQQDESYRTLNTDMGLADFSSNDYLGFSRSPALRSKLEEKLKASPQYTLGSGGSRLLSGNTGFTEQLEAEIAEFTGADAALLFNSGYDANVGLFSALPGRGDTIITDEYIHASIIDGARLSYATRYVFKHNDLESLRQKLEFARGRIYIAVESLYSMHGDEAPLVEICELAESYGAAVIVDEAHAFGVFGSGGRGLVEAHGLGGRVFARLITFGKALGVHGAAVLGSVELRNYLINFSRSFIYTTAPSFLHDLSISTALHYLRSGDHQSILHGRIRLFKQEAGTGVPLRGGRSGIQVINHPGNREARATAGAIRAAGYDVRAILSPTVPVGSECIRICIHNHNTEQEIRGLCKVLKTMF